MAKLWTDQSRFELWLEVETAALEAMVGLGLAPKTAFEDVKKKAKFDVVRVLELEAKVKHDVIAFLTNIAENVGESARYLHLGMTSSDLLDTTFSIQLCQATDLILEGTEKLLSSLKTQAFAHKKTICIGRSHGIHAEPTTFGLKLAIFYSELERAKERVEFARKGIAVGAISGPVGTYAHLSPKVEEFVCSKFGLSPEVISNQVIQRDRHAALFQSFALLAAILEQVCVEIRHLQRTEVREAEENFSKGQKGSSAMPHKRNPVLSENVTGLSRLVRAMAESSLENVVLWHERDISHSSVERVIAPDITTLLDFMLARTNSIIENLKVYPENMRLNLELTRGLYFSGTLLVELAKKGLSREEAYALVQEHALLTWDEINSRDITGTSFQEKVAKDERIYNVLSKEELDQIFLVDRHLAQVDYIFKRVFGAK
jgi:adenylosuccinate lyase